MPLNNIHQSSLSMALKCGEQFRRRYLEDEIIPPGIAAVRGTSLHKVNQVNLNTKIRTGQDEPLSLLLDVAEDTYRKRAADGIYLSRAEAPEKNKLLEQGLDETLNLTSGYRQIVAPQWEPAAVERKFVIDAGFFMPLSGVIDVETTDGRIQDLKSAGKSWSAGRINEEIQPVFYSYACEHETGARPEFRYHILIPLKTSAKADLLCCKHQTQDFTASDQDYIALEAKIQALSMMLQKGVFPPAGPGSWWCCERWCGYWGTCPYVGNGRNQKWV